MVESAATYTRRIAIVVQYLGDRFHGWQRQPRQRTVQEDLENALASILGYPTSVCAAGRTDAGVHAAAQVAHFDAVSPIPPEKWAVVLNARLPDDVLIRASAAVPGDWHARFSASWRRYRYTIYTDRHPNLFVAPFVWHYYQEPLDAGPVQAALGSLLGTHHLQAFHRAGSARDHSWVDVLEATCDRTGPFIRIEVQANAFLYGMMRLLVGMLVELGRDRISLDIFQDIWQNERRDLVKHAAPAKGLCLLRVGYENFPFPPDVWFDTMPYFYFETP